MRIALIVAAASNGVIGRAGELPWRLPGDLRRFREITMGKPIVMGRKTFDSIGRPLPGRTNIVVSRDPDFAAAGVVRCRSVESALQLAAETAERDETDEIMVIGGADIFKETLPRATRIYLTEVHEETKGDTYFPDFDTAEWREIAREPPVQGEHDEAAYSFVTLERVAPPGSSITAS